MTEDVALAAAIAHAISAVDRAQASGMQTSTGDSAHEELDRLRADLNLEADELREGRTINADRVRAMIRRVAKWAPESDISLLAALGAIARRSGA
jgi:hypothetical protein